MDYRLWIYAPNADLDGWDLPFVWRPAVESRRDDRFYSAHCAHRTAKALRGLYHGHLVAVVEVSRIPRRATGPQLPSFV
jgi:hypothetical protein